MSLCVEPLTYYFTRIALLCLILLLLLLLALVLALALVAAVPLVSMIILISSFVLLRRVIRRLPLLVILLLSFMQTTTQPGWEYAAAVAVWLLLLSRAERELPGTRTRVACSAPLILLHRWQ